MKELRGRIDKKYCSPHCKSAFQYQKAKSLDQGSLFQKIDRQLKTNRRILKKYNIGGKSTVRSNILLDEGFNPLYFTHFWKNSKGEVYYFCYEYGFNFIKVRETEKYVLVHWQSYMKKNGML